MSAPRILQFGTGRLLQAHVDLMVSEALAHGEAIGTIAAVQTTGSPEAKSRVAALRRGDGFPVRLKGLVDGRPVERTVRVTSVAQAFDADMEWEAIEALAAGEAQAIVSNTADRGYELDPADRPEDCIPRSFPAKLVKLLHVRWRHRAEPIALFPCELISRNGEVLRRTVLDLAVCLGHGAGVPGLAGPALHLGLLAGGPDRRRGARSNRRRGRALRALGNRGRPGLRPVCVHPDLVVTSDLARYERLKLYILNLGHTWLAERWLLDRRPQEETVREALDDPELAASLDRIYDAGGAAGVRCTGHG